MDKWLIKLKKNSAADDATGDNKKEDSALDKGSVADHREELEYSGICETSASNVSAASTSTSNKVSAEPVVDINRAVLSSYPKTNGRSFRSQWFDLFSWLEYSRKKDAAFCFACRVYGVRETKETTFTVTGFSNWKNALEKDRGLTKHESSQSHRINMAKWMEHQNRVTNSSEVSTLANNSILEKHRYYVSSIFDVIRFIVTQELSLRGSYDNKSECESGIFQSLSQYTLQKDKMLAEYVKTIPKNASYLSPEMQNEIIDIMAANVKKKVTKYVHKSDVPFFTILVDGTRDKNNHEAISICVRYVKDGKPRESLLSIEKADALNAEYCAELILNTLKTNELSLDHLLSQCYDGTRVMSGSAGDVQTLIQKKVNRTVPYVHCYNHQLHLIIISVVTKIPDIEKFFDYTRLIHRIFSKFKFKEFYDGTSTSRLLEQRWSGHLQTSATIFRNYGEMIDALKACLSEHSDSLDGIEVVEYRGLLNIMQTEKFRFILCTILKLLLIIQPADNILQKEEVGLFSSLPIIKSVYECLNDSRCDKILKEIESDRVSLLPDATENQQAPKRKVHQNRRLTDFVLTEKIGIVENHSGNELKRLYFEIFDLVLSEFTRRFLNHNALADIMQNIFDLDVDKLGYLKKFNNAIPTREEAQCVKKYFESVNIKKENYLQELYKQRVAFQTTYEMFAAVATFGCSSARCEATFSTLTRILTPFRKSMTFQRESNLTLLAFESSTLKTITNEELLRYFNGLSSRKLQLY